MKRGINIALLGRGTVAQGVIQLLTTNQELIKRRVGAPLILKKVLIRNRNRRQGFKLPAGLVTHRPEEILRNPDIHIVVELIGGYEPARSYILKAMEAGKDVVTANKALLAVHGEEIFSQAQKHGIDIGFEASVGGGIPIIRTLKEGLAGDRNRSLFAILNGTCNYILTTMEEKGEDFHQALTSAQELGYAEADPSFDVNGIDAAHKLAILVVLAFGTRVKLKDIYTEGIRHISPMDISYARELGYRIKLLAIARYENGAIEARVHPAMIPVQHPLALVRGPYNAVFIEGEALGPTMYFGQGAGMMPTATAVLADIIEIARNRLHGKTLRIPPLGYPMGSLSRIPIKSISELRSDYYLRFMVLDRPGVLAQIAGILGGYGISIASVIQKEERQGNTVPIVMHTKEATERDLRMALVRINRLKVVKAKSVYLRVVSFASP
ncbi:MAG: homoserine dehydrogenase [Deltaproteobacteria bacterium RIFCSPLOWO2_02_FULL_57_26]|nr:MAG: homoserine dehydrogenase [Deltaproteobacteria bacterium RIFCSPLOWO2_02_FULL_57_26]OGQ83437.1 MAG: homoserine dehydrogenase [Deltaproteobacteria bacterium RIFCSPLOWO2_12_FULL_57_22]